MSMIFSDIDGTLYGVDKVIHPELINNIKEAKEASIMFNIATGNGHFKGIDEFGRSLGAKYLITSNGARIYDLTEDKLIFENKISVNDANEILKIAESYGLGVSWWDEENAYYNKFTPNHKKLKSIKVMGLEEEKGINGVEVLKEIYKIEFFGDPKIMEDFYNKIKLFKLQIAKIRSNHFEVTKINVSKASAIEYICNIHNEEKEKTMTIGDSANDIKMLEMTEYSYAMANATQEVKNAAKLNAAAYNQNGVGLSIIDYIHRIKRNEENNGNK